MWNELCFAVCVRHDFYVFHSFADPHKLPHRFVMRVELRVTVWVGINLFVVDNIGDVYDFTQRHNIICVDCDGVAVWNFQYDCINDAFAVDIGEPVWDRVGLVHGVAVQYALHVANGFELLFAVVDGLCDFVNFGHVFRDEFVQRVCQRDWNVDRVAINHSESKWNCVELALCVVLWNILRLAHRVRNSLSVFYFLVVVVTLPNFFDFAYLIGNKLVQWVSQLNKRFDIVAISNSESERDCFGLPQLIALRYRHRLAVCVWNGLFVFYCLVDVDVLADCDALVHYFRDGLVKRIGQHFKLDNSVTVPVGKRVRNRLRLLLRVAVQHTLWVAVVVGHVLIVGLGLVNSLDLADRLGVLHCIADELD